MIERLRLLGVRTVRRRAALNILAALGGILTAGQGILLLLGGDELDDYRLIAIPVLCIGVLLAVRLALPATSVTLRLPHSGATLTVESGDLLEVVGDPIVVTMDRNFDLSPPWVAERSLIRQLVERWFDGDDSPVRAALGVADDQPGRDDEVEPGAVIELGIDNRLAVLIAVPRRHEDTRSVVATDEVWQALASLWSHCGRAGFDRVTTPVIGAGFSQSRVGQAPLLMLLITSFVTTALERPVCDLRVMLHGSTENRFHLQQLAIDYSSLLGMRQES